MTTPASDRDAALERLLARTLEPRAADGTGELTPSCADAEMAAAWADGTLSAVEREAVETHAADCGRCQALLAAMVATAPPAATSRSVWRMPTLGWLIPTATAAAAVIAWFVIPGRPAGLHQPVVATGPEASVAVAPAATPTSNAKLAAEKDQQAAANASTATPLAQAGARDTDLARQQSATEDRKEDLKKETSANSNGRLAGLAKPAPPAANRVEPKVAEPAPATPAPAGAPPAASSTSAGVAAAPPTGAGAGIADGRAAAAIDAARGSGAKALTPAGTPRPGVMFESILPAVIVSPDPASRWRVLSNGGVERSQDGGSTWEAQPTASAVPLSAGASPSSTVCWLVGRAGTVLLSTDGRSWKRLPFPETVDLFSITAIDGKTATVVTSDGRRFTTSDAGATWKLAA